MNEADLCNRCGLCCYHNGIPCKYLYVYVVEDRGVLGGKKQKTLCRIYQRRLGAACGNGAYCGRITDLAAAGAHFPGCPYTSIPPKK